MADDLISPLNKGLGMFAEPLAARNLPRLGWNLLREDLSLPAAVLYEDKLKNNLEWMQRFIDAYGLKLAPHGKTTMAPKLFERQLQAGAWGITLATAHQTRVAYEHGVRRVLMTNQLVGKQNMALIAYMLGEKDFDYYCLVDSSENVEQLGAFFRSAGRQLQVLIEIGVDGGRTGIRNNEQLRALLGSLDRWRSHIRLCGVELYEGVLDDERSIRRLLQTAIGIAKEAAQAGRFDRSPFLLSGAGSAWYDVVAEEFAKANLGDAAEIVLRPGCYLTHDAGIYRAAQQQILQRNSVAAQMRSGLVPALQLWAYVQSVPEKDRAIVALGKRDAAFDAGLPIPALHYRPGSEAPKAAPSAWQVTKMMDQHAYKWRYLCILDSAYQVIEVISTFF